MWKLMNLMDYEMRCALLTSEWKSYWGTCTTQLIVFYIKYIVLINECRLPILCTRSALVQWTSCSSQTQKWTNLWMRAPTAWYVSVRPDTIQHRTIVGLTIFCLVLFTRLFLFSGNLLSIGVEMTLLISFVWSILFCEVFID